MKHINNFITYINEGKTNKLPHDGVFSRISVTKYGVGNIAIIDIPENTKLFKNTSNRYTKINKVDLQNIPKEIQELYTQFCTTDENDENVLWCPDNFSNMGASWFLNHSDKPNVYLNQKDGYFYTLKDIKKGEELTQNYYDSFNEFQSNLKYIK